ncbi:MAG: hypothetical protein Q9169_004033 [Polycauliona sp. 2 TL-2023]
MTSAETIRFARITSRKQTPAFPPSLLSFLQFTTYSTTSWSLSFYPQPLLNLRRRSTTGTTPAFPFINTLGFISYFISTTAFYASPLIRSQYAIRNPYAPNPTVRLNDLVFTIHAVVMSCVGWSMFAPRIWGFEQGAQSVGRTMWGIAMGCILAIVLLILFVGSQAGGGYDAAGWAWIDVVYGISYIKLLITVVKYVPQVYTNYVCQSTVGWSIWQILLDLVGGFLSVVQLVIDSLLDGGDWSGVTGNPVKFALGNVTVVFDVIFVLQHYVWYRKARKEAEGKELERGEDEERRHLLDGRDVEGR